MNHFIFSYYLVINISLVHDFVFFSTVWLQLECKRGRSQYRLPIVCDLVYLGQITLDEKIRLNDD